MKICWTVRLKRVRCDGKEDGAIKQGWVSMRSVVASTAMRSAASNVVVTTYSDNIQRCRVGASWGDSLDAFFYPFLFSFLLVNRNRVKRRRGCAQPEGRS